MARFTQLVSPTSQYDAIAAYGRRLADALAAQGHAVTTHDLERDPEQTFEAARDADVVLLQYNPFCFGRGGLAPRLPLLWRRLRRGTAARLIINIHEPHAPWAPMRWTAISALQRAQLHVLAAASDAVTVSAERWAREVRFPVAAVIPVGSNVAAVPPARAHQAGTGSGPVVLVSFGTAHESRLYSVVEAACDEIGRAGVEAELVVLGVDAHHVTTSIPTRRTGPLDDEAVSRELAGADLMLAPFIDGVTLRRGSVVAGLQHGLAVLSTVSAHTDATMRDSPGLRLERSPAEFVAAAHKLASDRDSLTQLAAAGRRLFDDHFAWERIAESVTRTGLVGTGDER